MVDLHDGFLATALRLYPLHIADWELRDGVARVVLVATGDGLSRRDAQHLAWMASGETAWIVSKMGWSVGDGGLRVRNVELVRTSGREGGGRD